MFRKILIFNFLLLFLFSLKTHAGWPNDGWVGVESLDVTYHTTVVKLGDSHRQLSQEEEKLTSALPPKDATNIVLGKILFLGDDPTHVKNFNILGPQGKPCIFESRWESVLKKDPSLEMAQRLMRSYAPQLQKTEGLTLEQQQSLVADARRIVHAQESYQTDIVPYFEFYQKPITVPEILQHAQHQFEGITSDTNPAFPVLQKLRTRSQLYELKADELEKTGNSSAVHTDRLNRKLQSAEPAASKEEVLKNIQHEVTQSLARLSKQRKELESIGSKVVARYWHSESKFLKYLEESLETILSYPGVQSLEFVPKVIVLQIHSRFDICRFCGHVLARALTQPDGILNQFRQAVIQKYGLDSETPIYLTASFREEREKTKGQFKIEYDHLSGFEDLDLMKQKPVFPLMHAPSPSEL